MSGIQKRSLCKRYVYSKLNHLPLKCRKGDACRFYHPPEITSAVLQEYHRESGKCYCGASLRTLVNGKPLLPIDREDKPFFVVCSRTNKSIWRCRRA